MDKLKFKREGLNIFKEVTKAKASYPVISECPVCHNDFVVERLHCENCGSALEGKFTLSKFNYLDTDKLYFIEIFVKNRGNIKAIEKEMDLSYPTIKKMLDDVILELGYSPDASAPEEPVVEEKGPKMSKFEILEKINSGELSVEAASALLKKIK
ncbi:MAG: DUF2089 domain-containing protein [Firmicutes bacterium]|nr:DUF2089 domain-containing protein [Bacillota bacterium]